jgi:hypothetical protein
MAMEGLRRIHYSIFSIGPTPEVGRPNYREPNNTGIRSPILAPFEEDSHFDTAQQRATVNQ